MSLRTRFQVLRRDEFTCQYCGRGSRDVVLHVDHVKPRAAGGSNDPKNLITACSDCNLGKGGLTGVLTPKDYETRLRVRLEACNDESAAMVDPAFWPAPIVDGDAPADPQDVAWLLAHCASREAA